MKESPSILYGWNTIGATSAHEYLWPAIRRLLPFEPNPEKKKVLDIGCGNGYIAAKLHALGYNVTGIDQSADGIALASAAYPGICFEVGSVYEDLGARLGVGQFDLVVSSEVIEHLYLPRKLLQNAFLALRPAGAIVITTPYHGYLKNLALSIANKWDDHHTVSWDGGHVKFFSEDSLKEMLQECGFRDVCFSNAGRVPLLWKSIVCRAQRGLA